MKVEGGCYCGEVRYEAEGEPVMKGQCFCRECQYITGGDSVLIMGMPEPGYKITKGAPKGFKRTDIENAVTREFCPDCGGSLTFNFREKPEQIYIAVGSLDNPDRFHDIVHRPTKQEPRREVAPGHSSRHRPCPQVHATRAPSQSDIEPVVDEDDGL